LDTGVILEIWSKIWGATPMKIWEPETALPHFSQFSVNFFFTGALLQDITNLKTDY